MPFPLRCHHDGMLQRPPSLVAIEHASLMKSRHFNFNALFGILVYFLSSLGGIAIVKFLNYRFCFTSWLLLALLSRATWLLSLVLHIALQCFDKFKFSLPVSCYQLRLYLLIAIGLSVVELFNALSMSMLPGSLYMLLKGSDVGWSMALSYYLLDKRYSRNQVFAAMLIMTGVAMVFFINDAPDSSSSLDVDDASNYPVTMSSAAALCLCGAFMNALCAVGTEATLKRTLREEENRLQEVLEQPSSQAPPSKLLLSNAYSMWTSFFSFSLLVVPVSISFSGSIGKDFSLLENLNSTCTVSDLEHPNPDSSLRATHSFLAISACLGLLSVSRFSERLSKHWICVSDSAMTFSIVQAARRLVGVYIIGILFGERFSVGMIVGSLCSGIGFMLHCWFSCSRPPRSEADSESSHQYQYGVVQTSNADPLSDVKAEPINEDAGKVFAGSFSLRRDNRHTSLGDQPEVSVTACWFSTRAY